MGIENGNRTPLQWWDDTNANCRTSLELKKRMSRAFMVAALMTSARHPHEVIDYHGMSSYVSLHMHISNHIDREQT